MEVIETDLPGVLVLEPKVFGDPRGFFLETYREDVYRSAGIAGPFVQDNQSRSARGVLRGLHYQLVQPQGKLVRVSRGEVFDVAVDVRRGSSTFGAHVGVILNDQNNRQFYVPPGFAHGFCVLSDIADFVYKCTDYYHPDSEHGIAWNDPDIGIPWPLAEPNLSIKDAANPRLSDQRPERLPVYGDGHD
jgi:dTDP-4-dehydrorhamnose 3,5-epimerase